MADTSDGSLYSMADNLDGSLYSTANCSSSSGLLVEVSSSSLFGKETSCAASLVTEVWSGSAKRLSLATVSVDQVCDGRR